PPFGDFNESAADIRRRLVEKPVQVLVFYQRVRKQENEVVCSVLLGNPLGRSPGAHAAAKHDNVLHLLHPSHRRSLGHRPAQFCLSACHRSHSLHNLRPHGHTQTCVTLAPSNPCNAACLGSCVAIISRVSSLPTASVAARW